MVSVTASNNRTVLMVSPCRLASLVRFDASNARRKEARSHNAASRASFPPPGRRNVATWCLGRRARSAPIVTRQERDANMSRARSLPADEASQFLHAVDLAHHDELRAGEERVIR